MINISLVILLLSYLTIIAQLIEPPNVKITDEKRIEYQIYMLQKKLNNQFKQDVKEGKKTFFLILGKNNFVV